MTRVGLFFATALLAGTSLFAKPLRLHLSYYPTISAAGIYYAYDRGWYKDAGIDLKIEFQDLGITDKVASGRYDFALHSAHEVIRAVDRGIDVKAFAADYQLNPLALAAKTEFKALRDLRGKVIGYFSEQEKDFLRVIFSHEGVSLEELKFKLLDHFSADLLKKDLEQGVFDAFPVWEFNHPIGFALTGYNLRQFPSYRYGFHFYGAVFFARGEVIKERAEEFAKFLKVTREGWKAAFKDPEATVNEFMKKWYPPREYLSKSRDLTARQQLLQMKTSKRYLYQGVGPDRFGQMTKFQWNASLGIAKKFDMISNKSLSVEDVQTDLVLNLVEKMEKTP